MKKVHMCISVTFLVSVCANVRAFHDPDADYRANSLSGYLNPAPSTRGDLPAVSTYSFSNAGASYSGSVIYHAGTQGTSDHMTSQYSNQDKHGYATSAGLSAYGSRRIIPQTTYARAPIIAKITAAPLIAQYAATPPFFTPDAMFLSRSSLERSIHSGESIVTKVFAAARAQYAASPALLNHHSATTPAPAPTRYTAVIGPNPAIQVASRASAPTVEEYFDDKPSNSIDSLPAESPNVQRPRDHTPLISPQLVQYASPFYALGYYDSEPKYLYQYSVRDLKSGDDKQQYRHRNGDSVIGQYSVEERDGAVRSVEHASHWGTHQHIGT